MLKVRSLVIFLSQVEHRLWHSLNRTDRLDRCQCNRLMTKIPNPHRLGSEVEISQSIKFNKQRLHHCLDLNVLRVFVFFFCTFLSQQTLMSHMLAYNNNSNCMNRRISQVNYTSPDLLVNCRMMLFSCSTQPSTQAVQLHSSQHLNLTWH